MKKYIGQFSLCLSLCYLMTAVYAQTNDGFGQTIQISTTLTSFAGKPSWTLIIRDIDHGLNYPYVFDFQRGTNYWVALTYGHNYLITASTLQFSPYHSDPYNTKKIHNFCHLESNGKVIKGESMYITISGNLSPYTERFHCNLTQYQGNQFSIAAPEPDAEN